MKNTAKCNSIPTVKTVGDVKVERWFDGVAPDSVEGATLLGYSNDRWVEALYELKNGDFCYINDVVGKVVRRRDFLQFLADIGCPWEVSTLQMERLSQVSAAITAENEQSGYDAWAAAKEVETRTRGFGIAVPTCSSGRN